MHVAYAAVLLFLLTAGCASVTPDTPVSQPQVVAPQPATPQPAAKPVAPATPEPALATVPAPDAVPAPRVTTPAPQAASEVVPPVARTPVPIGRAPKPAAPPVAAAPAPVAAPAAPVVPLTLDLNALKERLKQTKAIGIFTKIALKNQVDDLLEQFSEYYEGKAKLTMTDLRRSYNLLMMKVLSLLQDADETLASAIVSSREAIWALLADPKTFATLQS
jgi:hypothetical protein